MVRVWLIGGLIAALFYVYSIVDCALFERERVRGLPKAAWLPVVIVFPIIGGVLWFLIGRGRRRAGISRSRTVAPDDDPEFLRGIARDRQQEERIRRIEKELSDLDDAPKKNKGDTDSNDRRDA